MDIASGKALEDIMNIKYRREKRARNLLYLIVAIIWMSSVFIGWRGIVQINKRCTIVLFGKVREV